jgi:hypothetical protein
MLNLNMPKLPKLSLPEFRFKYDKHIPIIVLLIAAFGVVSFVSNNKITSLKQLVANLTQEKDENYEKLQNIADELDELKNQDQLKRNNALQDEIKNIETTYNQAVSAYENLLDLKDKTKDTKDLDTLFSKALSQLSDKNYSTASATIDELESEIKKETDEIASTFKIPESVPENNAPPGGGFSSQKVVTDTGTFLTYIIAGDLSSTKVIVDTASSSDCSNECPTLPLTTYVSRNGAYAGIHGAYACPAEYPSCAGKTNSFDLLIMNKDKHYFNSDNNVYSQNPAVVFGSGWIRFVRHASEWGRDTSVDGVVSNFPLLVFNNELTYSEPGDNKMSIKSSRGFVANKGSGVYVGVVFNATVADSAKVMKALGMENAMNLDGGGTTALWYGGYKAGPGRNLTNAILFLRK